MPQLSGERDSELPEVQCTMNTSSKDLSRVAKMLSQLPVNELEKVLRRLMS